MKNLWILILALGLFVGLPACTGDDDDDVNLDDDDDNDDNDNDDDNDDNDGDDDDDNDGDDDDDNDETDDDDDNDETDDDDDTGDDDDDTGDDDDDDTAEECQDAADGSCSKTMPCCDEEAYTCAGTSETDMYCYANCEVGTCDYGGADGFCQDVSQGAGTGVCTPASGSMATSDCTDQETGCETEYGSTTNTICLGDGTGSQYCLEICTPVTSSCDSYHTCVPLIDGGGAGVCIPL